MKASELRIGNYIQDKDGNVEQVWSVQIIGELVKINDDPYNGYYQPVLVTEEWLFKLGCRKITDYEYLITADFNYPDYLVVFNTTKWEFVIYRNQQVSITVNVKFIHELQNTVFAFTGMELTVAS